jgi:hypothetical protein
MKNSIFLEYNAVQYVESQPDVSEELAASILSVEE